MGVIQTAFNASWKGLAFNSGVTQYKLLEQYEEELETRKRTSVAIGSLETTKANLASPTFTGIITIPTLSVTGDETITGTLSVTGLVTLANNLNVNGGDLASSATTFNLLQTNVTTLNIGGEATSLTLANDSTATQTIEIGNGVTISGSTKTINIGTGAVAGAITTIKLGSITGTSTITLQGNTFLTGTLNVKNTNIDGTLSVTEQASLSALTVSGITTLTGLLTANDGITTTSMTTSTTITSAGLITANGGISASTVSTSGDLTVGGNLIVNGTTTTVNSTTITINDPILTLGGDTASTIDDGKDRGIEFKYFKGSAKLGFFGFDDSTGKYMFLTDATNTSEVFSGTVSTIVANLEGNVIGNLSGYKNVDNGNEMTLANGFAGGIMYLNYRGATSAITALNIADGMGEGVLIPVNALSFNSITGLSNINPIMNGAVAIGTSTLVARQDHVHPSDTTKANVEQTMYIGTTALTINRTAGDLALTGITSIDGSASKWTTARSLTLDGVVTGTANIDGSGNVTLTTYKNHTHPQSEVTDDNSHQIERTIQVKCVAITSTIPNTLAPIDGYTPVAGDLVLLASANGDVNDGIYVAQANGTVWTRYSLFSTEAHVVDRFIKVFNGITYKNTYWTCVNKGTITVGTTALKIQQQFGDKTGAGLALSAQGVLSVTSAPVLANSRTIGILTGDIISGGSIFDGSANNTNVTVIANNAVTNNKSAQMPTMTMKGNNTGTTANQKDLTVSEIDIMLGITKKAMMYGLIFG